MTYTPLLPSFVGDTSGPAPYQPGDVVTCCDGRDVTIVACYRDYQHRWIVTFRYDDGRESSRTYARFHTDP